MRRLQRFRHDAEISRPKILSLERKGLVRPSLDDEIKCFLEPLAALLQGYAVAGILIRNAPAHSEFQAPVAEEVGGCRFFGDLYRVVQGQQGHRCPEADASRALRRCSQHHKRISQNRERAAEVNFAEPGCIKAESVSKLDLRNEVAVPLALRKPAR